MMDAAEIARLRRDYYPGHDVHALLDALEQERKERDGHLLASVASQKTAIALQQSAEAARALLVEARSRLGDGSIHDDELRASIEAFLEHKV